MNANCPPWCDRCHLPSWPVHTADCGDVDLGGDVFVDVGVARYTDNATAVINVILHDAEETRVVPLTREQAAELRNALDAAVNLLAAS